MRRTRIVQRCRRWIGFGHRWRAFAVGIAGVVALAACGASANPGSGSNPSAAGVTMTIVEWTNPPAITATKHIDQLFIKQHPGLTIKIESAPTSGTGWTTLTNSVLASKQVDLLATFPPTPSAFPPSYTGLKPTGTAALAAAGQLTNMAGQPFMKRFDRSLQQYAIGYKGGIYGVMAAEYNGAGALWYKPALLSRYHLSVPTTFNQFLHELAVFKSHGIDPLFVAGENNLQNIVWNGILYQVEMQGHPSSSATSVGNASAVRFWHGQENWNSSVFQEATSRYEQVMRYVAPGAGGVQEFAAPGQWAAQPGNYPFFVDGSWDGLTIQQANPSLKFGFFTLPGTNNPSDNRVPIQPDLTWTVPTWAPHHQLDMEWLNFFTEPANYRYWLSTTGSISTETGVSSAALPWMSWLNAHASTAFPNVPKPWTPTGAPTLAGGPDLTQMVPFGSVSAKSELNQAAQAYTQSLPHS